MKPTNKRRQIIILSATILVLAVLIAVGVLHGRSMGVHAGMSRTDYTTTISDEDRFDCLNFSFYKNLFGDSVVVRFSADFNTVADVQVYSKLGTNTSVKAFSEIETGMSIYDVVSKVGIPNRSTTSGMISMDFVANDGTEYRIYWNYLDTENGRTLTVNEIVVG